MATAGPGRVRERSAKSRSGTGGRLRIGDDWNAITIIALSQDNPLKAVAEFVENSIDAGARSITIMRGRERGDHYLEIVDDGRGVPKDDEGVPDFRYVATHICDSLKRRLRIEGARGIQGEFGIGLLSFWTVGEELAMSSAGADGRVHEMRMRRHDPGYSVVRRGSLLAESGTRLKIRPLLPGVRQLSGEKIQRYLASELRERIRHSGAHIRVVDRLARKDLAVEPRQFTGELLHHLPAPAARQGEIYVELYLNTADAANQVGLYRSGTRIVASLTQLEAFQRAPWTDGCLQGIVDAPFLNLTPATRTGVIHDAALESLVDAMAPVEARLCALIEERRRAEDERSSRDTLKSIQRAFREALLALPPEEYDWFDIQARANRDGGSAKPAAGDAVSQDELADLGAAEPAFNQEAQRQFFDYAGPLFSVVVSPAASTVSVNSRRRFRALPRDRSRRRVTDDLLFAWEIVEGDGSIDTTADQEVEYTATATPGLVRLRVTVSQREVSCSAEAIVTVTDSLEASLNPAVVNTRGLPGYTFERAAGALWRSRFDAVRNVIIVNNGHRDFVFATKNRALQLRYLVRLYVKELVLKNFTGVPAEQLLERMVELSLYAEEKLKTG